MTGETLYCTRVPVSLRRRVFVRMELRHLRYFVAVAEALSFTKGAEKLRLAQPSLTRQIKDLEEELGVLLLNRTKQRVSLTDEGRSFLIGAKRLPRSRRGDGRVGATIEPPGGFSVKRWLRNQSFLRLVAGDACFVPAIVPDRFDQSFRHVMR
jgi:DNA-binding MarR family transcriptional regulator